MFHLHCSLAFRYSSFYALDLLGPKASRSAPVLGSGEIRPHWALEVGNGSTGGGFAFTDFGRHDIDVGVTSTSVG